MPTARPINGPHLPLLSKLSEKVECNPASYHFVYALWKSIMLTNMRGIERAFAIFSIAAGFWMGWPMHMEYRTENVIYHLLVSHLPDWLWTVLFLSFGVPALLGCNYERVLFPKLCVSRNIRIIAACVSLWTWTLISGIFIYDKSPGLSTVWAPIVAIYQLWILLWLWVNDRTRYPYYTNPETCSKT